MNNFLNKKIDDFKDPNYVVQAGMMYTANKVVDNLAEKGANILAKKGTQAFTYGLKNLGKHLFKNNYPNNNNTEPE